MRYTSNFFNQISGSTKDCLFLANLNLDNCNMSLTKKVYLPNMVQIQNVNSTDIVVRLDAGTHYILAYYSSQYSSNLSIIDKIPKI